MMEPLVAALGEGTWLGPLLGLAIGALLGLSPVALPTIPAVVATMSRGYVDLYGTHHRTRMRDAGPVIVAFTAGMNGVLGVLGYLFVTVSVVLARSAVVLHVVAATVMAVIGIRLLLRRTSLCHTATALPPTPGRAFLYGVGFSIGGCPGCGPVALGVGAAAALVGGPTYGLLIVTAFVMGHAAVLLAAAALGTRILSSSGGSLAWARLDRIVGVLLLAAAAYYVFRFVNGDVSTLLPGETGSDVLP